MKTTYAFGLIDAQRGFMPAPEGARLGVKGFGELAVNNGEQIVPAVNLLLGEYALHHYNTFTTQDWHPAETAHFSNNPDFKNDWPVHCIAGEPGSELHPEIILPVNAERFTKGTEPLKQEDQDMSYTGYYAMNNEGLTLPQWLKEREVTHVALGGLALDYCVGLTALDLKQKMDLDVTVIRDAVAAITPESEQEMLRRFELVGIEVLTAQQMIHQLNLVQ